MTDGSLRMKTAEEDGGPERVRCHLFPEIVGFPVKVPLLNLGNGFHRSVDGVSFREGEVHGLEQVVIKRNK